MYLQLLIFLFFYSLNIKNSQFYHIANNAVYFVDNSLDLSVFHFFSNQSQYIEVPVNISYSIFGECSSFKGGALYIDSPYPFLSRNIFFHNRASIAGSIIVIAPINFTMLFQSIAYGFASVACGGFMLDSSTIHDKSLDIKFSNFSYHDSPSAAAIDIWDGNPFLSHCKILDSFSERYGCLRTSSYKPHCSKIYYTSFKNCSGISSGAYFAYWFNTFAIFNYCEFWRNYAKYHKGNSVFIGNSHITVELTHCHFDGIFEKEIYCPNNSFVSSDNSNIYG